MSRKKTNKVKFELETEGGEIAQVPNNKKKPFKIERGGIARPLGNGFYYLQGKSHENGGIDMTFNTDARIFSSVPFLNGKSPAERVMRGENPDTTFAWQERFKDVNRINDDGTRKAKCGKRVKAENGKEVKVVPTREEYITSKIDSTINAALNKSRTRIEPAVYYIPLTEENKDYYKENIIDASYWRDQYSLEAAIAANEHNYERYYEMMNAAKNAAKDISNYKKIIRDNCSPGPSCMYTTTDNFGKQYLVPGTQTFVANPQKYGFKQIDTKNRKEGDVQIEVNSNNVPVHGMIFDGYDKNNKPLFNYSSGGMDSRSIKKHAKYPIALGDRIDTYRFVGTPADSVRWTNEYNKLYMNNSNKKRLGGSTGLIRVQANGKDRLMYVPFTGEETKTSRKKAEFGNEVIITAPNKKREETLDDYFPRIADSISYPDSLPIIPPYVRTPYSIRTKTPADLERDMKVQMVGREFSNDTTSNYLDKVRFNEAYVPYDGEMAAVTPSTSVVPDSVENPIERINRGRQSEYKPVVSNNTVKEVNGVINTSWLPKRNNITVNIPKINTYDPRISMIGRTFTNNNATNSGNSNNNTNSGNNTTNNSIVSNKVTIPRFNTPSLNTKGSNLPDSITLNPNLQKSIDRMNKIEGSIEHAGLHDYTVPEVTNKQVRQQTRAALKKEGLDWVSRNKDWAAPAISALGNIGAGIASYAINKRMLGDLDYAPTPVAKRAAKLKTNININPELTALGETLSRTIDATNANTASSRVANARNQAAMLNTTLTANKLYADKENRETALINQDRLNQQEVANANIDAYNTWRTGETNFENTIREQLSENAVSLADNINKGIQTGITDAEKRRQFRNNLAVMAAAYPNVTPALLRSYGADFLRMGGKVKLNKKK